MKGWKPPWVGARYRYVHRGSGWDVIDVGNPENPRVQFPQFVASCESQEMAERVCDAMEASVLPGEEGA